MRARTILPALAVFVSLALGATIILHATRAQAAPVASAPAATLTNSAVVDDFESGLPGSWFQYGDYGNGTAITTTVVPTDGVPGAVATNHALEIDYISAGWGAGTGRNLGGPDWSSYDGFSFWMFGSNSGATYRVILSDNLNPNLAGDTAERFAFEFPDNFSGWHHVSIPWGAFFRDYAYQPPGAPDDGLTLTAMQAYAFALPNGTRITYIDDVNLLKFTAVDDFESGLPGSWFQYGDYGSGTAITTTVVPTDGVPGAAAGNHALEIDYISAGWGAGTGRDLGGPDWSSYDGFSFWMFGSNSGTTYRVILSDNLNPNLAGDTAERFAFEFPDNFSGWHHVSIPWGAFFRDYAYQPPGAPDDGLTLTAMQAYAFALPNGTRTATIDDVALFGGQPEPRMAFESQAFSVPEGQTATITVTLNVTLPYPVSVDYATSDGSATAGSDYTEISGTLDFPAGTDTMTFTVATTDDPTPEDNETVNLALSSPVSVTLGGWSTAVLTIVDNDNATSGGKSVVFDDFEDGALPSGTDPNGIGVGFITWNHPSASVAITVTDMPAAPVPGAPAGNKVLQEDLTIGPGQWAGFTHAFTNPAANQWLSQDWSTYVGVSLWVYGNNTGGGLFLDVLDNRNPGSTTDDAERYSVDIPDDFAGWQFFQFPWSAFHRKDIGNGAPNDGFTLTEVHGYAVGGFGSVDMGSNTYYLDDVGLLVRTTPIDTFEDGALPSGTDPNGLGVGFVTWNHPSASVAITVTDTPATPVPGAPAGNKVLQEDLTIGPGQWAGFTHAFTNPAANQWLSQDWSTYQGVCFWLYGNNTGGGLFLDVLDNRNPGSTTDDAERYSVDIPDDFSGWQFFQFPWSAFHRKDIGNGAPNDGFTLTEIHGYGVGGFGSVDMGSNTYYLDDMTIYGNTGAGRPLEVQFMLNSYNVTEGGTAVITATLNMSSSEAVSVTYTTTPGSATPNRDYVPVSGTLSFAAGSTEQAFSIVTLDDTKHEADETVFLDLSDPQNGSLGGRDHAKLTIVDNDPLDPNLIDDFETYPYLWHTTGNVTLSTTEEMTGTPGAVPGQGTYENVLDVTYGPQPLGTITNSFGRNFAQSMDWTGHGGLSFWYYGSNSGTTTSVELQDNRAPDPGPSRWTLVWSDEFSAPAGTAPSAATWTPEIGDGTLADNPGWGNAELEYYTDSTDNAATDGSGNLVITARQVNTATTTLQCYYGPCEYTSARLITANKVEFMHGRIEARIKVPYGQGLWPAFWMLGDDLQTVGWPQAGEIDIMENIGREPATVHGTIHGPGYSGGSGIGGGYTLPAGALSDDYHVFAVEWEPTRIRWFIDNTNYFTATVDTIPSGTTWVYNHPFYILLNVAVGGGWPGYPDPTTTFPQTMHVDYLRVYQAPDTAERFQSSFTDSFNGWQRVTVPFNSFTRSPVQPAGAPNDGLGLSQMWGYGFGLPATGDRPLSGAFKMDQVRLTTGPTAVTLANLAQERTVPAPWLPLAVLAGGLVVFIILSRRLRPFSR